MRPRPHPLPRPRPRPRRRRRRCRRVPRETCWAILYLTIRPTGGRSRLPLRSPSRTQLPRTLPPLPPRTSRLGVRRRLVWERRRLVWERRRLVWERRLRGWLLGWRGWARLPAALTLRSHHRATPSPDFLLGRCLGACQWPAAMRCHPAVVTPLRPTHSCSRARRLVSPSPVSCREFSLRTGSRRHTVGTLERHQDTRNRDTACRRRRLAWRRNTRRRSEVPVVSYECRSIGAGWHPGSTPARELG